MRLDRCFYLGAYNWLANRIYCNPDPKKILLLFPLLQENKRKLTTEVFIR